MGICGSYQCFIVPLGLGDWTSVLQLVVLSGHDCLLSDSVLGDLLWCEAVGGEDDWFLDTARLLPCAMF